MKLLSRIVLFGLGKYARLLPNKMFIYLDFYRSRGRLNLGDPRTMSEKIQWIKLYGNLEQYSTYVDKYTVRRHIERSIGAEYLVPLIGVWDTFDDIPFERLPQRFVIKATHGSGYNFICKDKSVITKEDLRRMINGWLDDKFYLAHREMQYQPCMPRIICEKFLEDTDGEDIKNYEIYCTDGIPQMIEVNIGEDDKHRSAAFDLDWRRITHRFGYQGFDIPVKKPQNLDNLIELATVLAKPFPFIRVDFYVIGSKIYFGELTLTPGAGVGKMFSDPETDLIYGKLINLASYENSSNR